MKTLTIKLPEREAQKLDHFIKKKHYPSKSEFIRHLIMEKMEEPLKERQGWLALAEKSLEKVWNNAEDAVWSKYL